MVRSRVMSFMSAFSSSPASSNAPSPPGQRSPQPDTHSPPSVPHMSGPSRDSPTPARRRVIERPSSRPLSMIQTYQPPLMEVAQDTLPELQPIFTLLNSHSNKLYQEGYFLKLNDLDSHGRPNADRTWTECFAQLVGTVLSLWDAAALDVAGQDGEVIPTFINLTDASIKMIETLPTRTQGVEPLHNVLSISTAGKNRYLLHFNSLHSLTQWTAGIRLAMFEHSILQEAYTGALIAGKGKQLNNIGQILERTKFKTEEWVRVRFGAGTPWRRCWCVISPPDEKEIKQAQRQEQKMLKKKSAYDRPTHVPKGDIKFYESKKTKKVQPIATITDAYSAYAIYPQSKPLIDQSTLIKVEGTITIHSNPPSVTEGFLFVMPEVHPAVSGFEMMLRWLFPAFDTFALYGRPTRLIADTLDVRSLMFAMPRERRYGYLEILDVATLIHADGSQNWREREWRHKMKEATARRMMTFKSSGRPGSIAGGKGPTRTSFRSRGNTLQFDDGSSVRSNPSIMRQGTPPGGSNELFVQKPGSVPPSGPPFATPVHQRSISEAHGYSRYQTQTPSRLSYETGAPPPPPHQIPVTANYSNEAINTAGGIDTHRSSSDDEHKVAPAVQIEELQPATPLEPVTAPPAFSHRPGELPPSTPYHAPELRRAKSRMSSETLSQLANTGALGGAVTAESGAAAAWRLSQDGRNNENVPRRSGDSGQRGVFVAADNERITADPTQAMVTVGYGQPPSTSRSTSPYRTHINTADSDFPQSSVNFNQSTPDTTYTQVPINDPTMFSKPLPPVSVNSTRPEPPPLNTTRSIARKPLPSRTQVNKGPEEQTPVTASSIDSLQDHYIDAEALDRVIPRPSSEISRPPMERLNSEASSNYDGSELSSPDYASTRKSFESRPSVERPRAGVLRTVGTADPESTPEVVVGDARYTQPGQPQPPSHDLNIPNIDFGPTYAYRPGTSPQPPPAANAGPSYHDRCKSQERLNAPSPAPSGNSKRGSYIVSGRQSPANWANPSGHSRGESQSSSRTITAATNDQVRPSSRASDVDGARSVAWQPGMASGPATGARDGQGMSPDQFVQQRASRVTPVFAHQRNQSSNYLRAVTPPGTWNPPNVTKDLPPRPHSRAASTTLSPSGGLVNAPDYSRLSAREQEHIARATGSPLVDLPRANQRPQTAGSGLVGAIQAREREKKEIKEGWGGQMVQQAIHHRQQSQGYYPSAQEFAFSQYAAQGPQVQPQQPYIQPQGQQWPYPQDQLGAHASGRPATGEDSRYQQGWPSQGYTNQF